MAILNEIDMLGHSTKLASRTHSTFLICVISPWVKATTRFLKDTGKKKEMHEENARFPLLGETFTLFTQMVTQAPSPADWSRATHALFTRVLFMPKNDVVQCYEFPGFPCRAREPCLRLSMCCNFYIRKQHLPKISQMKKLLRKSRDDLKPHWNTYRHKKIKSFSQFFTI